MGALKRLVPLSQIVFGSDYWFRTMEETATNLTRSQVFNAEELRAINRGNVERMLPKYSLDDEGNRKLESGVGRQSTVA